MPNTNATTNIIGLRVEELQRQRKSYRRDVIRDLERLSTWAANRVADMEQRDFRIVDVGETTSMAQKVEDGVRRLQQVEVLLANFEEAFKLIQEAK